MPTDRRTLSVASMVLMLVGVLHTVGNLFPPAELQAVVAPLRERMQAAIVPLGLGSTPSMWDIHRSLVFTMSIGLLTMGGLGLVVAIDPDAPARLRRRVAAMTTLATAALTVLYGIHGVAPPLMMLAAATLSFGYAWIRQSSGARPRS